MDLTSELLLKFPVTQIITLKNFKKSRITIHPQAYGFNLCYLNMFKNLTADLDISNRIKELHVWKTSEFDDYSIFNNINLYLSYLKQDINEVTSVHDKFHRTLILSGFCLLKIAKISLNSSFFPKPIKR